MLQNAYLNLHVKYTISKVLLMNGKDFFAQSMEFRAFTLDADSSWTWQLAGASAVSCPPKYYIR